MSESQRDDSERPVFRTSAPSGTPHNIEPVASVTLDSSMTRPQGTEPEESDTTMPSVPHPRPAGLSTTVSITDCTRLEAPNSIAQMHASHFFDWAEQRRHYNPAASEESTTYALNNSIPPVWAAANTHHLRPASTGVSGVPTNAQLPSGVQGQADPLLQIADRRLPHPPVHPSYLAHGNMEVEQLPIVSIEPTFQQQVTATSQEELPNKPAVEAKTPSQPSNLASDTAQRESVEIHASPQIESNQAVTLAQQNTAESASEDPTDTQSVSNKRKRAKGDTGKGRQAKVLKPCPDNTYDDDDRDLEVLMIKRDKLIRTQKLEETFEITNPEDLKGLRKGKVDPSKFILRLRHTNGPLQGRIRYSHYNEIKAAGMDWNDPKQIKSLMQWRSHVIMRAGMTTRKRLPRTEWTAREAEVLLKLVRRRLRETKDRKKIDWQKITDDFNDKLKGVKMEVGDKLASARHGDRPEIDQFAMPEEDPPRRHHPARTTVVEAYEFHGRTSTAIKVHAQMMPAIRVLLDGPIPDESDGDSDSDISSTVSSTDEDSDDSPDEDGEGEVDLGGGSGLDLAMSTTSGGTGILGDPDNYAKVK